MYDCDFIPIEYRERQRVRRMVRHRVIALVSLFGAMAVCFAANQYQLSSAQAMIAEVREQKSEIERVADRRREMEQARVVLKNLRQLLDQLSGHRSLVPVFSDLSGRIPDSIVLTSCVLYEPTLSDFAVPRINAGDADQARRAALTRSHSIASDPNGDAELKYRGLKLTGVARTVPDIIEFVTELDRSPLFFQVNMDVKEAVIHLGQPARRFELRCRLMRQTEAGR